MIKSESSCDESWIPLSIKREKQKRRRKSPKIWSCAKCNAKFDKSTQFRDHRKVHKKPVYDDSQYSYTYDPVKETYNCVTCDLEVPSKIEIQQHVKSHKEHFTCDICNLQFDEPYKYAKHSIIHSDDKTFKCPMCESFKTKARTSLLAHINTFHLHRYFYRCTTCGKGFNDCVQFKEHKNVHDGVKPFKCVVCEKDFTFSNYLFAHQVRNHKVTIDGVIGTNQCHMCLRRFANIRTLQKHMKKHENEKKKKPEKKHLCDICGKGYARKAKFVVHYRNHTGDKPFKCSYCSKRFTQKEYVVLHERVHSGEKPYACEFCGKCFNQGAPLKVHIRTHTGERPFNCEICDARNVTIKKEDSENEDWKPPTTSRFKSLKSNYKSRCSNDWSLVKKKQTRMRRIWKCTKCPEEFDTNRKLRVHRKIHQKNKYEETKYSYILDTVKDIYCCMTCDVECTTKEDIQRHVLTHEEHYTCEICNLTFSEPYKYATHMFVHSKDHFFKCPLCDSYKTPKRTCLLSHINTFHLKRFIYTCSTCGKGFNDCVQFKEHNNIHQGIRPFQCIVCGKDFPFSVYLHTHQVRNHRVSIDGVIGTNQCYVCMRSCANPQTLKRHIKKHAKEGEKGGREKKHLCDMCGKGFAVKYKLILHYRTHTGVKPYSCSYCAKSFTKRDYLVMHERIHSGEKPYSCEYCGKCFNQTAPLRVHIRSHTGERPFVCHICNSGFISKGSLNIHIKRCTGNDYTV
ncbi:zinc finger protein 585B-like [Agrilus planipennis]|nr:zinc finger protein 585B-like [Agrilus planipennis]